MTSHLRNGANALISIRPHYLAQIVKGVKTVELRRRGVRLPVGSRLWIYSTLPVGEIQAVATLQGVERGEPETIWGEYREVACVTWREYQEYFSGRHTAFVLRLGEVRSLRPAISLATIRSRIVGFQPPQFIKKLCPDHPLLELMLRSSTTAL